MKTIKLFLTTIALLLCSVMANAYDFEVDGIYYRIISSTDLTVAVTYGDNKYTGDVIIPSVVNYKSKDLTVITIGYATFSECSELTSITIPNSVITIDGYAFKECSSLTSITIPNSVTTIDWAAFKDCSSLTSITIPNGVITIGQEVFSGCISLTNITIPNSVTSIEKGAFDNCTSLKELRIEDGDTSLEMGWNNTYYSEKKKDSDKDVIWNYYHYGLFYDCPLEILYLGRNLNYTIGEYYGDCGYKCDTYDYYYSPFYKTELNSVTIGDLVTKIGTRLFEGCYYIEKITIPKNVTSIGNYAFDSGVKELYIEDGDSNLEVGYGKLRDNNVNGRYYYGLFYYCRLDSVYIGRNLIYQLHNSQYEEYSDSPFENSTLKSVTISDSVTVIGEELFLNCNNLTYVTIGNNVTTIQESAFNSCYSLTSITIPSSVEEIGQYAFASCKSLKSVHIEDSKKELSGDYKTFYDCSFKKVYLGRNLLGVQFVDIDSLTIGSNITKIGKNMLRGGADIYSIYSMCTNPPVIDSGNDFTESQYVNTIVSVPKGSLTAYQTAEVWKDFWDIQEYVLDKKFCVNYFVDGELYAVDSVKHYDTIILREEPIKEGYTFSGWSEVPETMPAHDVEVIGNFIFASVTDVKVDAKQSWKVIEDNQLFIMLPNGKKYNVMGQEVK